MDATSLLGTARALRPLLDRMAPVHDETGELHSDVVKALHESGLLAMCVPRSMGGAEIGPIELLEILEEIAYADGSTGWILMAINVSINTAAAYLPASAIERIFPGNRVPIIAGQGAPMFGQAVPVAGGYLISGHWPYGSGVKHAAHLHTGVTVVGENGAPRLRADGSPLPLICVVPRAAFTYHDNWDVMGLKGTGSIDYSGKNIFVPEDATHVTDTTERLRGGPFYRLGIRGTSTLGHCGFTIGLGRRILDELAELAKVKAGRFGRLADSESFLEKLGFAEAKLRSARAFLFETWRDIESTLATDAPPTSRQNSLYRLALNHLTWSTQEICSFAYLAGGGDTLRDSTIQRCFRDMHAATQHATSAPPILRDCARELAGLAEGKVWGFSTLVSAPETPARPR